MNKRINLKSRFEMTEIADTHLLITDLDGPMSITNDAENVVAWLYDNDLLDDLKLYYIDTEGVKSELLHDGQGKFTGFSL
jgi:hypothetical protein